MDPATLQVALDKLVADMGGDRLSPKFRCTDCGSDHMRAGKRTCNAHSRRATPKRPCRNFPPAGLPVCRFHGGGAPQVRRKGDWRNVKNMIEDEATALLRAHPSERLQLLPEPRPKKGGHKKSNSRSARQSRLRRDTLRRDEQLPD